LTLASSSQGRPHFDNLKSGSLISIGQLCDDECVALFTKYGVKILKHGKVIITGKHNAKNGLWNIPLAPKDNSSPTTQPQPTNRPQHQANGAIQNLQTKQDLAGYLHGCNLSPLPSTFLQAVQRGHYESWPGLTPSLISKHLPKALATSKGHLQMQQKNIRSTKLDANVLPLNISLDISPCLQRCSAQPTSTNPTRTKPENSLYNLLEVIIM
jgi:hypothetical protein